MADLISLVNLCLILSQTCWIYKNDKSRCTIAIALFESELSSSPRLRASSEKRYVFREKKTCTMRNLAATVVM